MTPLLHPEARLIDARTGEALAGARLRARVDAAAGQFHADTLRRRAADRPAGLVFVSAATDPDTVVAYLGAASAGCAVALLDPGLSRPMLLKLVARFAPALVTGVVGRAADGGPPPGYRAETMAAVGPVWSRHAPGGAAPHPDLGLLLTTSGSTGSPKLVRLSRGAVLANAEAIAQSLGITGEAVAPTTLPLFYTYGLSVLHSHLVRGATVVLTAEPLVQRPFWETVRRHRATSLAAVPYQYEMLRRLRFDPAAYPSLRTLTQAGGRLRPELVGDFAARMAAVGGALWVMYGQTEATARIAVLPPEQLADRAGSVGRPVPGGALSIRRDDGAEVREPGVTGEVVYRGPNVMMGYAESAADLARPDALGGVLPTGDVGHLDADGFLFLTGRRRRMGKIFGVRVNLDDIERTAARYGAVAAVAGDDRIRVFVEGADPAATRDLRTELADWLDTHSSGLEVRTVPRLPLLPTGKVDYRELERLA